MIDEKPPIGAEEVAEASAILQKYKAGKAALDKRIVDNELWFRMGHWKNYQNPMMEGKPQPASGWLFNSIANKHADAMDNYPAPNVLPRAADDAQTAQVLSSILPVVLEQADYEQVYSDTWWRKLKQGTGVKGVFWDPEARGGVGEIAIRPMNLLMLYWEPGVADIQASPHFFSLSMENTKQLENRWPQLKGHSASVLDVPRFLHDGGLDTTEKSVVVDWYYKKPDEAGHTLLHYCKFCNGVVLYASENDPALAGRGFYDHGKYPFVFDPLFMEEDSPAGFGYIDVMKECQTAIDRMNHAMDENVLLASKQRYVLATVGIVLLLLFSGVAVLGWLGWQEGCRLPQREYSSSEIADSMVETAEGLAFGAERTPQEWMNGYEWAMVLDDVGNIRWSYGLPQDLNHAYTPGDIAKFSRWYLADYPVFCWTEPYGLFVIGLPKGSLWKYSIYSSPDFALSMVRVLPAAALGLLLLGLVLCFWLSWRGAKRLETVANGLDALAQGQTVRLPTDGFAGELAEKLNQTGAQLQAKNEMLARRDNARTQWIAGVSHDVRTPLALILGWAEQLEQDALLPDSSRQKAAGIRTQCEKLRTLIDDLNLTSKLEYGAQPLRRNDLRAGPLFRQLVAQFCESPLAERCEITLEQEEPAEQTVLSVDEALLARLLENLLNNSVRHNPKPVNITVHTRRAGERFCLTVADDGIGYPPAVLAALNAAEPAENAPHILGLYVVQQIAAAHGGRAVFGQNTPHGAKAVVYLPLG